MNRRVEIIQRETVFNRFIFQITEIEIRHEKFDGSMSAPVKRLVLERGDAAAVLLHDTDTDSLLFCEQFRAPTIEHGDGWLIELPAGMIDIDESPEACARREAMEETGQNAATLTRIALFHPSPGGSSERVHVFYGQVPLHRNVPETAGLASEDEDIRILLIPANEAFTRLHSGEFEDAKTIIALQWLELKLNAKH